MEVCRNLTCFLIPSNPFTVLSQHTQASCFYTYFKCWCYSSTCWGPTGATISKEDYGRLYKLNKAGDIIWRVMQKHILPKSKVSRVLNNVRLSQSDVTDPSPLLWEKMLYSRGPTGAFPPHSYASLQLLIGPEWKGWMVLLPVQVVRSSAQ